MTNSVGLNTPNSPKYYAIRNEYNVQRELGKLQLTQYNQHTTNDELSITEHSHMQTRHSFLVYNMADRSNRWYGDTQRNAAVRSSAEPTPHTTILRSSTNIDTHPLRLLLTPSKGQKSKSRGGGILWRPPSRTACYICLRLWVKPSIFAARCYA